MSSDILVKTKWGHLFVPQHAPRKANGSRRRSKAPALETSASELPSTRRRRLARLGLISAGICLIVVQFTILSKVHPRDLIEKIAVGGIGSFGGLLTSVGYFFNRGGVPKQVAVTLLGLVFFTGRQFDEPKDAQTSPVVAANASPATLKNEAVPLAEPVSGINSLLLMPNETRTQAVVIPEPVAAQANLPAATAAVEVVAKPKVAVPPRKAKNDRPPVIAAPQDFEDLRLRVIDAKLVKRSETEKPLVVFDMAITNTNPTMKFDDLELSAMKIKLKDNFENVYKRIPSKRTGTELVTGTLYPGETIVVPVVFECPIGLARSLALEVPVPDRRAKSERLQFQIPIERVAGMAKPEEPVTRSNSLTGRIGKLLGR